jgi:hypothetical protein
MKILHLRRCVLGEATHVAVCVKKTDNDGEVIFNESYIGNLRRFFSGFYQIVHEMMTCIFSDKNTFGVERGGEGIYTLSQVQIDTDGTRFFMFMFRRYNLDVASGKFVPGVWNLLTTIQDICAADLSNGLSTAEVEARRHVVGRNLIEMKRPNPIRTMMREFSKPFYTYQIFMVWSVSTGEQDTHKFEVCFANANAILSPLLPRLFIFKVVSIVVLFHGDCLDVCDADWCIHC